MWRAVAKWRTGRSRGVDVIPRENADSLPPVGASDDALLEWNKSACSWPALYYSSTVPYLRAIGAKRFAEVGVAYGYHAEAILAELNEIQYVGVDPYLAGYDEADAFVRDVGRLFRDEPQSSMDRLHLAVDRRLANSARGRARILRAESIVAAESFSDGYFDAVFIDGNHQYESVWSDLLAWWPKIRPGGSILGDDYQRDSVAAAWEEFVSSVGADRFVLQNMSSGYRTVVAVQAA